MPPRTRTRTRSGQQAAGGKHKKGQNPPIVIQAGNGGTGRRGRRGSSSVIEFGPDGKSVTVRPENIGRTRAVRAAHTYGWRMRRILLPLYLMAACGGLAWPFLRHPGGGHAAFTAGLAAAIAGGVVLLIAWHRWLHSTAARLYLSAVMLTVTVTLAVTALRGTAALGDDALLWTAAAVPHWWRNKHVVAHSAAPDMSAEQEWAEFVACTGGPVPGSKLTGKLTTEHGYEATIHLVRGKQTASRVIVLAEEVASALAESIESVALERHPTGRADLARFTRLHKNPLHDIQYWKRPTLNLETGIMLVGPYASGGFAEFRPFAPAGGGHAGGAMHSLISGAPGSGKSQFLSLLILEYMLSEVITTWVLDPQNGQSLPDVMDYVDWAAVGIREGMDMLRAAYQVVYARSAYMGKRKIKHFVPAREFPLLRLVIDEAHAVFSDPTFGKEAVKLVEDIGKLGRKTGVGMDLVTQIPSLAELGNSEVIRSMVSSGTVFVFRCSGRMTGHLAFQGQLAVDPTKIPQQFPNGQGSAGLMYLAGVSAREAAARAYMVTDVGGRAKVAALVAAPLDPFTSNAAGKAYAGRVRGGGGVSDDDATIVLDQVAPPVPASTLVPAAAVVTKPGRADPETEREDAGQPESWRAKGYTPADVAWRTVRLARGPLTKGEVVYQSGPVAQRMGRTEPYKARMIGAALAALKAGLDDGRRLIQEGDGGPYDLPPGVARITEDEVTAEAGPPPPAASPAEPAPPAPAPAKPAAAAPPAEPDGRGLLAGVDLAQAAEFIVRTQFGADKMLVRRMKLEPAAAAAVMAELARLEIVGAVGDDGTHPVLYRVEQLPEVLAMCQPKAAAVPAGV